MKQTKDQLGFDFASGATTTIEEQKQKEAEEKKSKQDFEDAKSKLESKVNQLCEYNKAETDKYKEYLNETETLEDVKRNLESLQPHYDEMIAAKKEEGKAKQKKENKPKTYKYPFTLHMSGRNIETDHIFEEDKDYTDDEIRTKMLEHQYYDFSGNVTFEYLKDENVLLPIFQQHKKG